MNININTIPDPVFIFDNTGMLIDTNEAFFQLIGFSIESNESPSLNDFAPQLYQEINKDIFVKSIYADKHLSYNTTINNKVGNEIIVKLSLSRITLRDESLFFSISTSMGITPF